MAVSKKGSKKDFYSAQKMIFKQPVSANEKLVYMYLRSRADEKNTACPFRKEIAQDCGVSLREIDRAIKKLVEAGLIKKTPQYYGEDYLSVTTDPQFTNHRTANLYTF